MISDIVMSGLMSAGHVLSQVPDPGPDVTDNVRPGPGHYMTPTVVASVLLIALTVDVIAIGPEWIRDRVAFLLYLAAFREGFNASPLDRWTLERLQQLVQKGLDLSAGSEDSWEGVGYLASASAVVVTQVAIGGLIVYSVAMLVPEKWSSKGFGKMANWKLPRTSKGKVNFKLVLIALALGMLADVPSGVVGGLLETSLDVLCATTSALPQWLYGVSNGPGIPRTPGSLGAYLRIPA